LSTRTAAEFPCGLKLMVCQWAKRKGVPCQAYPICLIKKRATGRGNAGKAEMIFVVDATFDEVLEADGYETSSEDHIADGATVLLLGLEDHGKHPGLVPGPAGLRVTPDRHDAWSGRRDSPSHRTGNKRARPGRRAGCRSPWARNDRGHTVASWSV
jgi:hypothetical protein